MNKTIFLVRHGLSEFNKQGRMQGSSNASRLSDEGKQMAQNAGGYLRKFAIDQALASPLARAKQTAEMALSQLDQTIDIETVHDLRETEMYMLEGLTFDEIKRVYPQAYHDWKYDADNFSVSLDEGEVFPIRDLYKRSAHFWQQHVLSSETSTILIVSHGGTIQALINTALGLDTNHHHTFQQSNCGINRLMLDSDSRQFYLRQLNDTTPQGQLLPKLKAKKKGLRTLLIPSEQRTDQNAIHELGKHLINLECLVHESILSNELGEQAEANTTRNLSSRQLKNIFLDKVNNEEALENMVVFAPVSVIRKLLSILKVKKDFADKIEFQQGTLTVVHNVSSHPTPIIQCVNVKLS